jgi:methionyl-tRNA formyltransferase
LQVEEGRLFACCGEGSWIQLLDVQLEGKKRMPSEDFLRGFPLKPGDRLGP